MLSIQLMMEMARRAQGQDRSFWKPKTAELAREAAQQAVYCLDAPDDIPAGGMYGDEIAGEPLPMQMVADRETYNLLSGDCTCCVSRPTVSLTWSP